MWHLLPHLGSGPLPVTISHKRGQPYLGLSLWLWWDLFCHGKAYSLLGVPSRHEVWLLSLWLMSCVFLDSASVRATRWWLPGQRPRWWVRGGTAQCSHLFRVLLVSWWHDSVALGLEVSSRCPVFQVPGFGSYWCNSSGCELKLQIKSHKLGAKAHARNEETTGFVLTASFPQWLRFPLSTTNRLPSKHGDTSDLGKGSHQPSPTTRFWQI